MIQIYRIYICFREIVNQPDVFLDLEFEILQFLSNKKHPQTSISLKTTKKCVENTSRKKAIKWVAPMGLRQIPEKSSEAMFVAPAVQTFNRSPTIGHYTDVALTTTSL